MAKVFSKNKTDINNKKNFFEASSKTFKNLSKMDANLLKFFEAYT